MRTLATSTLLLLLATTTFAQTTPPLTAPAEAKQSSDGIAQLTIREGSGAAPVPGDFVTLAYTAWDEEGTIVDSTAKHPEINTFALEQLSAGLKTPIATMKVGEKRQVWVPAALSPRNTALIYEVELTKLSRPLDAPADVAAPPADAEKSESGLAWKVLNPGSGGDHPKKNSWVVVKYTGWNTRGEMFDSTYLRGDTSGFKLDAVIPGWREGLQMMTPGEVRRFWIPERLAYKGQKKMPQGMLVFDIELVRFR